MIQPIDPSMAKVIKLAIDDKVGGTLTMHVTPTSMGTLTGIVISDAEGGPGQSSGIFLDRADRAALIAALIELQETDAR